MLKIQKTHTDLPKDRQRRVRKPEVEVVDGDSSDEGQRHGTLSKTPKFQSQRKLDKYEKANGFSDNSKSYLNISER
jgi:hypothetical protein